MPRDNSAAPLKVAIIGAGKMAQHHARAIGLSAVPATVAAVADPSPDSLAAMGAIVPGARRYADAGELLASEHPDVVHIVTPPSTHEALARQALEAGCHVYVEKPFTDTVAAAERLLSLARERGRLVCPGHQLLFEPVSSRGRALVPALGQLVHVESYFSFRPTRRLPGGRAPQRTDHQFMDVLPHPVYLLLEYLRAAGPGVFELRSLEIGPPGTVHALISRNGVTGSLVVTLSGRPIESYVRVVGTNGMITLDFVRGAALRLLGPGTSGIDKAQAPYRLAWQWTMETTRALFRRVFRKQLSYPGLRELCEAFYGAIRAGGPAPFDDAGVIQTVRLCEAVGRSIEELDRSMTSTAERQGPLVVITGATGFLGGAVTHALRKRGASVRAIARRLPAPWERVEGVEYRQANLGDGASPDLFSGADAVIHCAAETAGGWEDHQRNSLDAAEFAIRAAATAGVPRFVHVSSLAVLDGGGKPQSEQTRLLPDSRSSGPYVWGKLESERKVVELGRELGIGVRVVRPGAIVDFKAFDPPGRLGKRLGNFFVAVGSPGDRLGVVDLDFTAETLAWTALYFDESPPVLNLIAPEPPTKRSLLLALRKTDPDLKVIWLPRLILIPLSAGLIVLQKLLRPQKPAMNVARVFAVTPADTTLVASLESRIRAEAGTAPQS